MHPAPAPRGLQALLLLHLLAFAALGLFGLVRLFMAYLGNAVDVGSLLTFGFAAAAALSAWGLYALSQRNPLRNHRAMALVALLAWADAALIAIAVPALFYRLRSVPWTSWGVVVPTAIFALLASRAAFTGRGHGVVPAGGAGDAAEHAPDRQAGPA